MKKFPHPDEELLLRNEAEQLLLTQTIEDTDHHTLSTDELRREYAVQKIMLRLQQQKLNELVNSTAPHSGVNDAETQKQGGLVTDNPVIKHADVLEDLMDGYIELDNKLCYTYVNRKIESITGFGLDYYAGKHIWDVFPGEVGTVTYHAIQKAFTERVYAHCEDFYQKLGVWHESHIYPTTNGLSIFVRDITARKKTELHLQETCEIGKIGGWEGCLASKELFLSKQSCQILGIEENSTLTFKQALNFFDIAGGIPGNLEIHQNIRAAVLKGQGFDEEIKIKLANGREKWLRIKGRTEFDAQKPARVKGILQDITKIKEVQEKLYENEKRFRVFMNNSPLAAWIVSADGFFDYVNKQYYTLFGPKGIVVGKNITEVYPDELARGYTEENKQLLLQKETLIDLKHTLNINGQQQHFLVNKFLLDEKGSKPKIGGIAIDVTEQIRINEQIANQQRFLKGITDNAPGLMSYWRSDLICTFTNQTAKEWLGTELQDIVGHNMKDVLGEDLFAHNYPYIQRALQGEKVQFERGGFNINGAPGFIWVQYVPDIQEGEIKGFYSLVTDITELKKTQLAIEFEERDKEALINSSNDFIASLDRDLRIVTANKAYKDLFGSITGVQIKKGDSVRTGSGFDEATWALWNSFFQRALAGESFTEETVTRPEGTNLEIWTECSFNPVVQNGQITGLACYSRDITERKKAQDTIKNNEKKISALLQNISDIITLVDENAIIKYVSPSVNAIMGYAENEVLDRNIFEVIHPDDHALASVEMQKALQQPGYSTTLEIRLLHKNGHYVHIEVRGTNQLTNPLIKALLITCRDITERKTAEQAIAESYEKLEDYKFALDQSSMVYIADANGIITYVNDNFCRLSEYPAEELIGNRLSILDSGFHPAGFFDELWQTIRSGKVWKGQVKNKAKDGSYYWINATVTPFMDASGVPYQYLGIDTDITQTRLAKEALAESNERFEYVLEATFDAIWDLDMLNKTILWGDGYKKLFGYEAGLSVHDVEKDFYRKVHPDDLENVLATLKAAFSNNSGYWSVSYRFLKADKEYAYVVDKAIIIKDADGRPVRMIGAKQDITAQKKAELATVESYKKLEDYKFAIDQSNTVFIMDDSGTYLYVNDNFCKLTRYTREEIIGQNRVTLASGYHDKSFFDAMWQTLRCGKVWRSHVKGRAKDGACFWVEATITPFMDGAGKPYQYLSINSDITQTKLGEEALAISNERFQYVTRATFDAIWDWDIANKTIFWGDGYKTLFGYEPGIHAITPNKGFSVYIHPDERKKILTSIYDSIDSGASYWSEGYRYRKAGGAYAYVIDKAIIIRDGEGHAIRMIGAMQDNTERRMAAEELKKSELKFRSMVYNIADVITLLDENGFVLYCSPSLTAVLGYTPEEVIGLKMFSLMHPDDYARSKEVFKNLKATKGNGGIIEAKYKHKNGHYITVESQGNNQLHNPAINAVVLTTRDTTKRKEKEEEKLQLVYELMEKNADLKQFSYITSHNLRAPLTNLIAICSLLDTDNISQEETHELINAFKTSTIKLNDTLNDLIKILIIKDGKSQEIETVYFDKTLSELKASITGMIDTTGAVIHADFSAAASVNFYSAYMESILLNLLTNSIKYAYPGRKPVIAMQTRDEEKFVVLTFMDNGMGMNMHKVKSKIFGLYQRFHSHIDGKGIGLYLVQSQVTALGGSITVDSKEGEGTTFVIWFKKELFGKR